MTYYGDKDQPLFLIHRGSMSFFRIFTLPLVGLLALSSCVVEEQSGGKLLTEADAIKPLTVANNVAPNPDSGVSKVIMGLQHELTLNHHRPAV